eukprot:scaffold279_cov229-Pinguiococcus_pyrenoidosus.AAC.4
MQRPAHRRPLHDHAGSMAQLVVPGHLDTKDVLPVRPGPMQGLSLGAALLRTASMGPNALDAQGPSRREARAPIHHHHQLERSFQALGPLALPLRVPADGLSQRMGRLDGRNALHPIHVQTQNPGHFRERPHAAPIGIGLPSPEEGMRRRERVVKGLGRFRVRVVHKPMLQESLELGQALRLPTWELVVHSPLQPGLRETWNSAAQIMAIGHVFEDRVSPRMQRRS